MTILVPVGVCLVITGTALGDHYFRDEFYYLACSRHMAWGYVNQPPLSIGILWVIRHLAGDSLIVLRVAAALVLAITIWLTGRMAKRLGGSPFAQVLAMTATAIAPELLAVGSYYSMNVFDLLFWTLAASILIEALESPRAGRWALLGVVLGAGLDNKISTLWLGAGIAVGLTLTSARRLLLTPGPWIAAAAAAALFAPHVIWQIATGWPTLEFIRNASRDKMQLNTPVRFIADQIMNMHPVTLPIWFGGLVFLLFARRAERVRPLGVAFLTVAVILILNRTSRSGYLAPAYPVMFAAGGAALDGLIRSAAMRGAAVGLLILAGAATAPLAIPLLSADAYVRYSGALGVAPSTEEKKELGRLPQFFADRQGWDRFVGPGRGRVRPAAAG